MPPGASAEHIKPLELDLCVTTVTETASCVGLMECCMRIVLHWGFGLDG